MQHEKEKIVFIISASSDSPLNIPAGIESVKDLMDRSNGAIFGWLVRNNTTQRFQRCNAEFVSCIVLPPTANIQSAGHLGSDFSSNKEAVWYYNGSDIWLCIYNFTTDTSTCPFGFAGNNIWASEKDSTGIYISYQAGVLNQITKLGFDGTAPNLASEGYQISEIALTDNRVVYFIDNGINEMLKSVPKAGGIPVTLVSKPNSWSWPMPMLFTKGNRVFYNVDDNTAHFFAGYVLDDGSVAYEVQDSLWSYFTLATTLTNNDSNLPSLSRLVRTDGCARTPPYCANGVMKSFDAGAYSSTASGIDIGTVPPGFYFIGLAAGWIGVGNDVLTGGWDGAQTDVFYFKADAANPLQRITNTPAVDEFPAFFF